ncbi:uncharacterized protein LOC141632882 [Silene latifolia]|uniref:uncharacterized protein LOC141632882 n=1 Tax=Silene latifolia TaxID=37657 RepID=UPI003D77BCAC
MISVQFQPWNLNGFPLVFKGWSPTVAAELDVVTTVPVWVIFPNLDPYFCSQTALGKVASYVGKPICVDETTTNKSKIAFARVLVEVDISKELLKPWLFKLLIVKETTAVPGPVMQDKEGFTQVQYSSKQTPTEEVVTTSIQNKFSVPTQEVESVTLEMEVLDFLLRHKVDCGAVIETHIQPRYAHAVHRKKFRNYSLLNNYGSHTGGRIWLLWNPGTVHIQKLEEGAQSGDREALWNRLRCFSQGHQIPWTCMGDFNVSLTAKERLGCLLHVREMAEFRACLSDYDIADHPYTGVFLPAGVSDHSSLLQNVNPPGFTTARPFRYVNCWSLSQAFQECVQHIWQLPSRGKTYNLFHKLKLLKRELRGLLIYEFSGLSQRVEEAKSQLLTCQLQMHNAPLNTLLLAQEKDCLRKYTILKPAEIKVLAHKAKLQHLQLSDLNSKYFYAHIKARRIRNTIGIIEDAQAH